MGDNVLFVRSSTGDEDDPWDDSKLISAYEEAIEKAEEELSVENPEFKQKEKKATTGWKVGDLCRCKYSVDNIVYEAQISRIINEKNCVVRYLGYENEEIQLLDHLEQSAGKSARAAQKKRARKDLMKKQEENLESSDMDVDEANKEPFTKKTLKGSPRNKLPNNWDTSNLPTNLPPPPHLLNPPVDLPINSDEALSSMLLSWYMAGFHTGYYEGFQKGNVH